MSTIETAPPNKLLPHRRHEVVPEMRGQDFQDLIADIDIHGIKVPIEVDRDGVTVLDGIHRLRAAQQLGLSAVPIRVVELKGESDDDYVLKAALLRRHLTDDQRAAIAALLAREHPGRPGRPPKEDCKNAHPAGVGLTGKAKKRPALAKAATTLAVSLSKAEDAAEVLNTDPVLLSDVRDGKVDLRGARKEVRRRRAARRAADGHRPGEQDDSPVSAASLVTLGSIASAQLLPATLQADAILSQILGATRKAEVDPAGSQVRPTADFLVTVLKALATRLDDDFLVDLGDGWAWLDELFSQVDRVRALMQAHTDTRHIDSLNHGDELAPV